MYANVISTAFSHADPRFYSADATSFWTQLKIITVRQSKSLWRNPDYGLTRLLNHITVSLFVGLTFLSLDNSLVSLQYRVFAIFFVTFLPAIIISQVEPAFIGARSVFYREQSSKMYSQVIFATSQIIAELPYSFLCAVAFFLLVSLSLLMRNVEARSC